MLLVGSCCAIFSVLPIVVCRFLLVIALSVLLHLRLLNTPLVSAKFS